MKDLTTLEEGFALRAIGFKNQRLEVRGKRKRE